MSETMQSSRIIIFLTVALSILGLIAFFVMPREEDPRIKRRNAVVTIVVPGASAEKIERMVNRPLEDELMKVQELKTIETEIRLNVAVLKMELKDNVRDLSLAWREVENAIERAVPKIPAEVPKPLLDFKVLDVEAVVLAITGSDDHVVLIDAAHKLRDQLLENPDVAEVKLFGAPELEVLVSVNQNRMHELGISVGQLLGGLQQNNRAQSSGVLVNTNQRLLLNQDNDAVSIDSLRKIEYGTGRLKNVELKSFTDISRTITQPINTLFRWNHQTAVGIGIIPKQGLNIEEFGTDIRFNTSEVEASIRPLKLEVVAFQPQRTNERIDDLLMSLLTGMILMAVFLTLTTSATVALIVSICIPVICLMGLFGYYLTGGVLHQISIAAFVISIGQFIDNIIVVIDSIRSKIHYGMDRSEAATESAKELRLPMAFATLTGICAFLPMLSAQGPTADFIFSLPLVAVITLVTSYFVAILFTPMLAKYFIRPEKKPILQLPYAFIEKVFSALALGPYWRVAIIVLLLASVSALGFFKVEKEFFPESDRNEFLFSVDLNTSADTQATNQVLKKLEDDFREDPRVKSFATFVGGDIPRFYYNLPNPKAAPQSGQVLVTTKDQKDVKSLGQDMERSMKMLYPEFGFTAQFLQQGPPINAKIELNIFSDSFERREELVKSILNILNRDSRLRSVRGDDFLGLKEIQINAKDTELADIGLTRNDLGQIMAFYSTGVPVSSYRFGREIIPIRVRASDGLYQTPEDLKRVRVAVGRDRDFELVDLANFESKKALAILRRENGQTFSRVLGDLNPGVTFSRVLPDLQKELSSISLRSGERIQLGGDAEGAGEANDSILKVVPPAMILLVLFLLIEFRSFRKVLIAGLALPVTLMGVFPGLWLGGAPFGFMSLLGILALVGIAINNIILLLEAMDSQGSLKKAIGLRLRAIILTTVLTLLGLIPLALSESSLWPPLAWTMISGLLTGTIATLVIVPALYRLFFKNAVTLGLLIFLGSFAHFPQSAHAGIVLTVDQIMAQSNRTMDERLIQIPLSEALAADRASGREAFAPRLTAGGNWFQRDQELKTATPFGSLTQEKLNRFDAMIELRQPIVDIGKMSAAKTATERGLDAARLTKSYDEQNLRLKFGAQAVEILILEQELQFLDKSIRNIGQRQNDIKRLIEKGLQSRSDLLKLSIAQERLIHSKEKLVIESVAKVSDLQQALGFTERFSITTPAPVRAVSSFKFSANTGDFQSLRAQAESLEARKRQLKVTSLPTIDGYVRRVGSEGRTLTNDQWTETGLEFKWELWGGGVRSAQADQLQAQRSAVEIRESLLRRQKETSFYELQEKATEKIRWLSKLDQLAIKAMANRKSEERRYFEGRGSLNDLIDADNLSLELIRDKELIELSLVVDCMNLQLMSGYKISAECKIADNK